MVSDVMNLYVVLNDSIFYKILRTSFYYFTKSGFFFLLKRAGQAAVSSAKIILRRSASWCFLITMIAVCRRRAGTILIFSPALLISFCLFLHRFMNGVIRYPGLVILSGLLTGIYIAARMKTNFFVSAFKSSLIYKFLNHKI